ncbi:hypothetical protein HU675_0038830 [Bradyrhizobium septentrionale]|uniref:hypothetical protein n=1 Tax=Bradyrhizobium septentrionale TaxID=1404411 RepID=UPI001596C98F|nr:hypothetical protein [Bradyrhizobium septentrionale]UGY23843.1 hypothetical protein HU675_0038830 [Bradyrhizobium septentrionale]
MNLRILKKLSARAAPLLPLLGDRRDQFPAERDDACIGIVIRQRKNFERVRSVHAEVYGDSIKVPARDGKGGWINLSPPGHARKGTIMVGGMDGGEQPEWNERSAWEALCEIVHWGFVDINHVTLEITPTRELKTPSQVLAAARDMIAEGPAW